MNTKDSLVPSVTKFHLDYDNIELFTGKEVEHTPTYGMQTLFVNGKPTVEKILEHAVEHIYLGANHQQINFDSAEELEYYNTTIKALLAEGYYVTVDYDAHQHHIMLDALDKSIWNNKQFVPMLSVHIPKVLENDNLTIKIADQHFKGSNGGVWCMNMEDVSPLKFTPWIDYTNDEMISKKED